MNNKIISEKQYFFSLIEAFDEGLSAQSFFKHEIRLELIFLSKDKEEIEKKINELIAPDKIFPRDDPSEGNEGYAYDRMCFREVARICGVDQNFDKGVFVLEKIGNFICSRKSPFYSDAEEIFISISFTFTENSVLENDSIPVGKEYIFQRGLRFLIEELKEKLHYSYLFYIEDDGDGRVKKIITDCDDHYYSRGIYPDDGNIGYNWSMFNNYKKEGLLTFLYNSETKEEYSKEDYNCFVGNGVTKKDIEGALENLEIKSRNGIS